MNVTIGNVGTEGRMAVMAELVRKELLKLEGTFKVMSPTNILHLVTEAGGEGLSKVIQLVNN